LLALSAVAVHIVHGAQVRRHGRTLLAQSEEAENGGELDRASVRLARYLQLVPDDTEVLARYADLLDQAAATPAARLRAIDVLRQVLARDPSREDLRRRLVALAMDAAAYTEAICHIDGLMRLSPSDVRLRILRGRCLQAQGEFDAAVAAFEEAINWEPRSFEAHLRLAGLLLAMDQPGKAGDFVDRLVSARHEDTESLAASWKQALDGQSRIITNALVSAAFWGRCGGPHACAALAELEALGKEYAAVDQSRLVGALALAHYRLGHLADAERLARRWADFDPSDLVSRLLLLDLYLDASRKEAVQSLLPQVRALEGEQGVWWRYGEAALACLRGGADDRKRARELLADLSVRRPGWSRVSLLEAHLDEMDGDVQRSLDNLVRCVERGDLRPTFVYQVSHHLAESGRYADADAVIARLEQQAKLGRDFARFATEIALLARNPERALTLANQAVSNESQDFQDQVWRGGIMTAAGRWPEAEQAYRRAVALAPHSSDAWQALSSFFASLDAGTR